MYLVHDVRVTGPLPANGSGRGCCRELPLDSVGPALGGGSGASSVCRMRPTVRTVVRNVRWYPYLMVFTLFFN